MRRRAGSNPHRDAYRSLGDFGVAQRGLLLRCDRDVVKSEEAGQLQKAEFHFRGVTWGDNVIAELHIARGWLHVRVITDHCPSPTHLEAIRCSSEI